MKLKPGLSDYCDIWSGNESGPLCSSQGQHGPQQSTEVIAKMVTDFKQETAATTEM